MKTRTLYIPHSDLYRVDLIEKGEYSKHYFKTEKESEEFVKEKQK